MPVLESKREILSVAYARMTEALSALDDCQEHLIAAHLSLAVEGLALRLAEDMETPAA